MNLQDKASALFSTYTFVNSLSYSSVYDVVILDKLGNTSVDILCYWSWLLINLIQSFQHLNYKLNLDFDFNWICTHFFETWNTNHLLWYSSILESSNSTSLYATILHQVIQCHMKHLNRTLKECSPIYTLTLELSTK